jgi:hypothetical protein
MTTPAEFLLRHTTEHNERYDASSNFQLGKRTRIANLQSTHPRGQRSYAASFYRLDPENAEDRESIRMYGTYIEPLYLCM